ncbi:MAG: TolC family protein [bacterium]|jgi:outer membrane protein TolC|nr:TolC family protein [candidate division KSB1 bacterium]MDH7560958.1 TolC family protein [bacterium]
MALSRTQILQEKGRLGSLYGHFMKQVKLALFICAFFPGLLRAQGVAQDTVALSLSAALKEALSNNELLKKSAARTKAGQASLQQAEGELLPKVDANFSYGYLDIVPGFKRVVLGNIEHDLFPNIAVSQPLYTGGRLKHAKQAAAAEVQSLEQAFLSDQLNLKLAVTLDYYQLQSLRNQRQILLENRRQLEVQQRYARLLVEAGPMSQLELDRIGVAVATTDGNLLKIQDDYQAVSYELCLLLGRERSQLPLPQDSLQVIPFEQSFEALVPTALERNPIWKQLEYDLRKAEAKVKVQQAARLPQISAQAYCGYEFGLESFWFDRNKRNFWGLNAKMPLYEGNVIGAKIDEARANLEQIQWQREYFRKNLATQVQNSYARLKEKEQQLAIQQQAVELARQSYRLAMIEYHAGRRSNTGLLDIQKSLLNAQLTLNQAALDYAIARVRLLAVMGIL